MWLQNEARQHQTGPQLQPLPAGPQCLLCPTPEAQATGEQQKIWDPQKKKNFFKFWAPKDAIKETKKETQNGKTNFRDQNGGMVC